VPDIVFKHVRLALQTLQRHSDISPRRLALRGCYCGSAVDAQVVNSIWQRYREKASLELRCRCLFIACVNWREEKRRKEKRPILEYSSVVGNLKQRERERRSAGLENGRYGGGCGAAAARGEAASIAVSELSWL
jgi:hypothetical protein